MVSMPIIVHVCGVVCIQIKIVPLFWNFVVSTQRQGDVQLCDFTAKAQPRHVVSTQSRPYLKG